MKNKIFHKIKKIFHNWDVKIMSYVMLVIASITLIAATLAWLTFQKTAGISDMRMATASYGAIKVAIEEGGEDVDDLRANLGSVIITLNMPLFYDVESYTESVSVEGTEQLEGTELPQETEQTVEKSKLAPGVYGDFSVYVTPLGEDIDSYYVIPTVLLTYIDGTEDAIDDKGNLIRIDSVTRVPVTGILDGDDPEDGEEEQKRYLSDAQIEELRDLTKGHILFGEEDAQGGVIYTVGTTAIIGEKALVWNYEEGKGEEKPVTLYFSWAYEYNKLPQAIKKAIAEKGEAIGALQFPRTYFFEETRDNDASVNYSETQLYDYADTKIGTYVKDMKIQLEVVGYHAESETLEENATEEITTEGIQTEEISTE